MEKIQLANLTIVGDNVPDYVREEIEKIKREYKFGTPNLEGVHEVQRGTTIVVPKGYFIVKVRDRKNPLPFREIRRYFRGTPCIGSVSIFVPKRFKVMYVVHRKTLTSYGVSVYICK